MFPDPVLHLTTRIEALLDVPKSDGFVGNSLEPVRVRHQILVQYEASYRVRIVEVSPQEVMRIHERAESFRRDAAYERLRVCVIPAIAVAGAHRIV